MLLDELDRLTSCPPMSMPKRIAALVLYARATSGADEEAALQTVVQALGVRLPTTPAGLKKSASEARAILQFGLKGEGFVPPEGDGSIPLLQAIAEALDAINVREVTKARAAVLGGFRGGRKPRARPFQTLQAVQGLIDLARMGSAEAEAELAEIRGLLGLQAAQPSEAAACGGSSRSHPVIVRRGLAA